MPFLLESILRGSLLLAAAALVAVAMRKQSAAKRHLVWITGLLALLAAPLVSLLLPSWDILPPPRPAESVESTPIVLETIKFSPSIPISNAIPAEIAPEKSSPFPSSLILIGVWIGGVFILLSRALIGQLKLDRIARRSPAVTSGELAAMLVEVHRKLDIGKRVRLVLDDDRSIPMTWGFWRPVLLLPADAPAWEPARQHAVLCHELAHIKRRDAGSQWIAQIACALNWFNPLVWIAARRIDIERERACDDLVLAQGWRASDYAGHLLQIVTGIHECRPAFGAIAMAKKTNIEGRIVAILGEGINRSHTSKKMALGLATIGLVAALPIMLVGVQAETQKQSDDPDPKKSAKEDPAASDPFAGGEDASPDDPKKPVRKPADPDPFGGGGGSDDPFDAPVGKKQKPKQDAVADPFGGGPAKDDPFAPPKNRPKPKNPTPANDPFRGGGGNGGDNPFGGGGYPAPRRDNLAAETQKQLDTIEKLKREEEIAAQKLLDGYGSEVEFLKAQNRRLKAQTAYLEKAKSAPRKPAAARQISIQLTLDGEHVEIGGRKMDIDSFTAQLAKLKSTTKLLSVVIGADPRVSGGSVTALLEKLKEAGVDRVQFKNPRSDPKPKPKAKPERDPTSDSDPFGN